ncbi:MAG: hypothetical protein KC619_24505, partial [Myxococcales bacterium]|nr:hypothetical protein [Myxococcales bacterium]
VAVAWDEGVAALDARTGREIFVRPDLASAEAGFYETVGTVLDVAVLPNGLVALATFSDYPGLVVLDDAGDFRISAAGSKGKRTWAIAPYGLAVLAGGAEKGLREHLLLPDELVVETNDARRA